MMILGRMNNVMVCAASFSFNRNFIGTLCQRHLFFFFRRRVVDVLFVRLLPVWMEEESSSSWPRLCESSLQYTYI